MVEVEIPLVDVAEELVSKAELDLEVELGTDDN